METIMSTLSTLFYAMIDYAGAVVTFIISNPLVLMFVVLGLVGIGVGLIRRLIRL